MKLNITQLGTPKAVQTSRGQAEKNYLKAQEFGDKFLNFWLNNYTRNWKVGDTIEVMAVEERPYTAKDGSTKTSYDIKLPPKEIPNQKQFEEVNGKLTKIELLLTELVLAKRENDKTKNYVSGTNIEYPTREDDDIPFDTKDLPEDLNG